MPLTKPNQQLRSAVELMRIAARPNPIGYGRDAQVEPLMLIVRNIEINGS
ncbi:hypothetical protein RYY32_006264 [Pseudomonas aeruginosa]|nr:hypothetical protein [Pseudomonas aeruginosa]ELM3811842.1 hypothetical protein [Pseudomonas aeruginosa]HCI3893192.1 hypothetical protein [Pseudomonas aeruginosa]